MLGHELRRRLADVARVPRLVAGSRVMLTLSDG